MNRYDELIMRITCNQGPDVGCLAVEANNDTLETLISLVDNAVYSDYQIETLILMACSCACGAPTPAPAPSPPIIPTNVIPSPSVPTPPSVSPPTPPVPTPPVIPPPAVITTCDLPTLPVWGTT